MSEATLVAWSAAPASAGLLALFLWRGRMPGRLYLDALAIGLALGAAVAVALAPFDLRTNPLRLSPQTLAFVFAALPEEGVKLLGAAAFLRPHYLARDRRDVVFAAGALSLGFAALENLFYLANAGSGWAPLAFERALTATPFHVFTGLAAGFAIARRPSLATALLAWLGLAAVHGAYDFAVFASAPGAAPEAFRRAASVLGLTPGVALRALLCVAEATAAALAGAAAIAASRAPRAALGGGLSRALASRLLGRLIGVILAGGAVVALGAGALTAIMLESADLFLRAAAYAIMPLALGVMFIAAPAPRAPPAASRRPRAWAGAGVAAALAVAAAAWTWAPAQWRLLNALRFEARGARFVAHADYGRAIEAYGEALAIEPGRVEVLSKRAEAFAASNRYDSALADLDAALRAAPGTLALYVQRAELNRRRDDPGAAARDLDAALQRKPGDPELLALRAQARLGAGDAQGADDDLAEARGKAPGAAVVRHVSAASEVAAGDLDAALRDLNAALHDNAADAEAAFQRGRVWLYKREAERARDDFIRADTAPPSLYPALWRFLAEARLRRDGGPELRRRLVTAPEKWPAPVARMLLGELSSEAARAAAADKGERCEADFYFAMSRLSDDPAETGAARLRAVVEECPTAFIEREGAKAELRRLAP